MPARVARRRGAAAVVPASGGPVVLVTPALYGRPSAGLRGLPAVRLLDRVDQLGLRHRGAAADLQPARDVEQVLLGGVRVDALGGLRRRVAAAGGLAVRRALPALRLPVVADLLERVLQRRERRAVGALALAVLLDGAVVRLRPGLLGLLRRALERAGEFVLGWHDVHLSPGRREVGSRSSLLTTATPAIQVTPPRSGRVPAGD